jgi:hypothetical protein
MVVEMNNRRCAGISQRYEGYPLSSSIRTSSPAPALLVAEVRAQYGVISGMRRLVHHDQEISRAAVGEMSNWLTLTPSSSDNRYLRSDLRIQSQRGLGAR